MDSEGAIYCGEVESTILKRATEEVHTIIWTVPDFVNCFEKMQYNQAMTPKLSGTASENNFQLRIERCFNSGFIIGYKSMTTVFLKSVELKMFTFDLKRWVYNEQEQTVFVKNHVCAIENKWNEHAFMTNSDYENVGFNYVSIKNNDIEINPNICLLTENNLHLKFEFVVVTRNTIHITIPTTQLSDNLESLLREGKYSDVVMKSANGEEFKVHKAVLASRSEVLKAHFEPNMRETSTNTVESPLETAVLRQLLAYIYTDRADVAQDPAKLLAAADYYQLGRLKSLCEDSLYKKLTVSNAKQTLQLAELHDANTLKTLTMEFMMRNGIKHNETK